MHGETVKIFSANVVSCWPKMGWGR